MVIEIWFVHASPYHHTLKYYNMHYRKGPRFRGPFDYKLLGEELFITNELAG